MNDELVHLEVQGAIGRIALDSPENRNALSRRLQADLRRQFDAAIGDERVRVIVLTAVGSVFCSGADLKEQVATLEVEAGTARPGSAGTGELHGILAMMLDSPKPIVGRINGAARAGGLGLVAACDIAVAVDRATFATSEVRVGVIPALISALLLPRLGPAQCLELFLTGEPWSAQRSLEGRLLNAIASEDSLDAAVEGYVASLLKGGPKALAGSRALVRESFPMPERLAELAAQSAIYFQSEEGLEGMRAFGEKRPPRWAQ